MAPVRALPRIRTAACLLLAVAATCLGGFAAPASAGEYKVVEACKNIGQALGIRSISLFEPPGPIFGFRVDNRCEPAGDGGLDLIAQQSSQGGLEWEIAAQANLSIQGIEFERVLSLPVSARAQYTWELNSVSTEGTEDTLDFVDGTPATTITPFSVRTPRESELITGRLTCSLEIACEGFAAINAIAGARNMSLTMRDDIPPFFTKFGGSLFSTELVRGTQSVDFTAEDRGSGIARAFLVVDGVDQPGVSFPNGGKCVEPYTFMVPCSLSLSSSLQLNTRRLIDGRHEIKVGLIDGAGNRRESLPALFSTYNAPISTGTPEISGRSRVGGRLTVSPGAWDGSPTAFSYQWLRCPELAEQIAECKAIGRATGSEYVPSPEDLQARLLARVTATNAQGSASTFSEASQLIEQGRDERLPALSGLKLSRKAFRVGSGRAARGTVLRFSSSDAGRLGIAIRRKGGRVVGVLVRKVGAGRGKVAFSGRVKGRALPPGRYELLVSVADGAGNSSKPARLGFKVLTG